MERSRAAVGSALFFLFAPGGVAGVIPWLITRWDFDEPTAYWIVARVVGVLLIAVGLVPLVHAFVEFTRAGGTPAPVAAPQTLVVTGFNRHVRNPMYVGVIITIVGQALLFGQLTLLMYAAAVWAIVALFVFGYEEPTLSRQFGNQYDEYRDSVPRWIPRRHPWHAASIS